MTAFAWTFSHNFPSWVLLCKIVRQPSLVVMTDHPWLGRLAASLLWQLLPSEQTTIINQYFISSLVQSMFVFSCLSILFTNSTMLSGTFDFWSTSEQVVVSHRVVRFVDTLLISACCLATWHLRTNSVLPSWFSLITRLFSSESRSIAATTFLAFELVKNLTCFSTSATVCSLPVSACGVVGSSSRICLLEMSIF